MRYHNIVFLTLMVLIGVLNICLLMRSEFLAPLLYLVLVAIWMIGRVVRRPDAQP